MYLIFIITGLFVLTMVFLTIFSFNIVRAIVGLILSFLAVGVFFIILGLEYLGFLIFIIYVGAISIIFLFVVMLLDIRSLELQNRFFEYFTLIVLVLIFFLAEVGYIMAMTFDFHLFSVFYENMLIFEDISFFQNNLENFSLVLYNYYYMYVIFVAIYMLLVVLVILFIVFFKFTIKLH
jgi:NADH:ubiquinone oxidoreductase subunit 6 (subunit J)